MTALSLSFRRPQFQLPANFAKFLLGFSFMCIGFTLMYVLWYSPCPKPFSGDGFMTATYIKAALWVVTGIIVPYTFRITQKKALVFSIILFVAAGLMLYLHSQI